MNVSNQSKNLSIYFKRSKRRVIFQCRLLGVSVLEVYLSAKKWWMLCSCACWETWNDETHQSLLPPNQQVLGIQGQLHIAYMLSIYLNTPAKHDFLELKRRFILHCLNTKKGLIQLNMTNCKQTNKAFIYNERRNYLILYTGGDNSQFNQW